MSASARSEPYTCIGRSSGFSRLRCISMCGSPSEWSAWLWLNRQWSNSVGMIPSC